MKVSVIILDFLKAEKVIENVKSILKQEWDFDLEIIIVDNSCDKKNAKILKILEKNNNIKLFIQEKNIWYSKWNNFWVKNASWDFIFIINPDILLKNVDIFSKMTEYMKKNADIWILWPKQENENWTFPAIARKFPNIFTQIIRRTFFAKISFFSSLVWKDELRFTDLSFTREVDWLQSSFFIMKKEFWKELGWFSEDYHIFMADSEICFKSWKKWKKVVYFSECKVFADWKRASEGWASAFFRKKIIRQHLKDSLRYFFKHLFEENPRKKYYIKKNNNLI